MSNDSWNTRASWRVNLHIGINRKQNDSLSATVLFILKQTNTI